MYKFNLYKKDGTVNKNMLCAAEKIAHFIQSTRPAHSAVFISGPGAVGKTTFSSILQKTLDGLNVESFIIGLDCYLIERALRPGLSGYNPLSYRLDDARRDIKHLRAKNSVYVSPYDQKHSSKSEAILIIPNGLMIIEGSMALTDHLHIDKSLKIYMTAKDDVLFNNRLVRELHYGFNYSYVLEKFNGLADDKKTYIDPQIKKCDILIEFREDFEYEINFRVPLDRQPILPENP